MMVHKLTVTVLWTVYITSIVHTIQFIENTVENSDADFNSTTLYPVDKIPFVKVTTELSNVVKISEKDVKIDRTTWNINTSFANPNIDEETHLPIKTNELLNHKDCKETYKIKEINDNRDSLTLSKENKNVSEDETYPKNEKEVTKKYKENEDKSLKEFKPSPHLNSYYDTLDDSPLSTAPTQDTPTFLGSSRNHFKPHHNNQEGYVAFPYKYETYSAIDNSAGWGGQSLQSKPTIEAPVRIPAGGLYKFPDVLREKPNSYEDNDYHPDSIDNVKESPLKKKINPWKSLLHLVTALLPVGLIVSALTPTILTIEEPSHTQHLNRASRRLDVSLSPKLPTLPAVSEDCKRRLLCEIHSDRHYDPIGRPRPKQCHRLRCEDPRALSNLLHWLLTYHRTTHTSDRGYT